MFPRSLPAARSLVAGCSLSPCPPPPAALRMVLPDEERAAGLYRAPPELVREAHVPSLEKYRELYRRSVEEPQGEWQARPGSAAAGGHAGRAPGSLQAGPRTGLARAGLPG